MAFPVHQRRKGKIGGDHGVMRVDLIRRMAATRRLAILLSFVQLSGCNTPSRPAISALPPPPNGTTASPPRINGAVGTPNALPAPQVSYGAPQESSAQGRAAAQAPGDITLDFADTDIREVVAQILGNILKLNYTIDPSVHGTATLRTVRPLARAQLLSTLQALLAQDGAALVQEGALYRGRPAAQAPTGMGADATAGSTVVPLHYASADDLAKVLQPYVGTGGKIVADSGHNALLVGGDPD